MIRKRFDITVKKRINYDELGIRFEFRISKLRDRKIVTILVNI